MVHNKSSCPQLVHVCLFVMYLGWEVSAPGWGCVAETDSDLQWPEKHDAILDFFYLNEVLCRTPQCNAARVVL